MNTKALNVCWNNQGPVHLPDLHVHVRFYQKPYIKKQPFVKLPIPICHRSRVCFH